MLILPMQGNPLSNTPPLPRPFALAKWAAYLFVPLVLWMGINFDTLREFLNSRAQMRRNAEEVSKLEGEYARLMAEKTKLASGGFPAEKAIRERFKMALPGEKVIYIEEPTRYSDAPTSPRAASNSPD